MCSILERLSEKRWFVAVGETTTTLFVYIVREELAVFLDKQSSRRRFEMNMGIRGL